MNLQSQVTRLPPLSGQSFQSHPPGTRYVFLGELPNEGVYDVPLQQEPTIGTNHHALPTPGKHDVRPPMIPHEPWSRCSDDRDDDVVFFVPLERIDVEYGIFPGEICGL